MKSLSVTLTLANDPYQRLLPAALMRRGMLRRLLRLGPDVEVWEPGKSGALEVVSRFPVSKTINRILWGVWRRLPGSGRSHLPMAAGCWVADRWAARHVVPTGIFHGLTGVSLASMRRAKRQGAVTILESPMTHLRHWQEQILTECKRFGVRPRECGAVLPLPLIRRAEREYQLCDRIQVLSAAACRSFARQGLGHKAVVVLPGVDHRFFRPSAESQRPGVFRALYVGRVEVAKGVGYLLEAWKRLALPNAELVLVGEVSPEMRPLLGKFADSTVRLSGVLDSRQVAKCYRESRLFVFPSANEGFGLVVLEAMASGLPIIATQDSGAADCVTEATDGFVLPARDIGAFAAAIDWCFRHPEETLAMGRAARKKIERRFTLQHYEQRQIALYQSAVGQPGIVYKRLTEF